MLTTARWRRFSDGLPSGPNLNLCGTNVSDDGLLSLLIEGRAFEAEPHRHQGHSHGRRQAESTLGLTNRRSRS